MNNKSKTLLAGVTLLILGAIVGLSVRSDRRERIQVQTEEVTRYPKLISQVIASGEIRPKEYVQLQAEVPGLIREVYVQEGDAVQQGTPLLRIDPTQTQGEVRAQQALLEARLAEAASRRAQIALQENNLGRDRARLEVARAEQAHAANSLEISRRSFHRHQQLFEENLISRESYENADSVWLKEGTALKTARARVQQAKAEVAVAQVLLEQTRHSHRGALSRVERNRALMERKRDLLAKTLIRSPLAGVITRLNVEAGERAVPGTLNHPAATLMEIADLSIIQAEVEVDETDIVQVQLEQEALVEVDALPATLLRGTVAKIGSSIIQTPERRRDARDFKVVIRLSDPVIELRPGLSCTAEITVAERENALAVPIQALILRHGVPDPRKGAAAAGHSSGSSRLQKGQERQGVFAVREEKAVFVPVETGIMGETDVEIVRGPGEGTRIVTGTNAVLRKLRSGDRLTIENEGD